MERVHVEDVESRTGPADVKRPLTDALAATDLALNYYELAPGDSFAFGYHAHADQEEVFYVQSGTVTFETDDGPVAVGPGELVRFAPGEYQQGTNRGDERVVALALGAPKESGDLDLRRDCPDCGERTTNAIRRAEDGVSASDASGGSSDERSESDGEELVTVCEDCGAKTGRFD